MKILITGGFGFVGARIAQCLSNAGYEILLGSRLAKKNPEWCPKAITAITHWADPESLVNACKGVHCIIHAAGMNALGCANDPVEAIVANGLNTAKLIRAAEKTGVKKIIYLSTAHVYSSSLSGTITEDTCPTNLHPYATSHRIGEDSVLEANQSGRINGVVFRLSNAFGVPASLVTDAWSLLVNDICRQSVINEKIILHSDGRQYRDFVSLSTVVQTIVKVAELNEANRLGGIFNLGSGKALSVLEMAELVASRYKFLFKKGLTIEKASSEQSSVENLTFSVGKIFNTGLFVPSDLAKEIDALLLFCRRNFPSYDTK